MATSFLKPHTAAEIETLLASEPESTAPQSCVQLCARIDNDFDIIDNLEDFPPSKRATVRAFAIADIRNAHAQMKAQQCPACPGV